MSAKHKARELAVQLLYIWDANGELDAAMGEQAARDFSDDASIAQRGAEMARAAWCGRDVADPWIERLAPQWPIRRQPAVDRSILRLAVWELTASDTPPKVAIDEAIELAKEYSTELSAAFVNGVLDAVLKEKTALISGLPVDPPTVPVDAATVDAVNGDAAISGAATGGMAADPSIASAADGEH